MQCLAVLNLRVASDILLFRDWHRAIVSWGIAVCAKAYQEDFEHALGGGGRPSAAELLRSVLKVTCPESLVDTALVKAEKLAASQASEHTLNPPAMLSAPNHTSPTDTLRRPRIPLAGSIKSTPARLIDRASAATRAYTRIPAPAGKWSHLRYFTARRLC
jgi:hypothetical protein